MGPGDIYLQQSLAYLTPYDLSTILYLPGAHFLLRHLLRSYSALWKSIISLVDASQIARETSLAGLR